MSDSELSPERRAHAARLLDWSASLGGRTEALRDRYCICGLRAGAERPPMRPPASRTVVDGLSLLRCVRCGGLRKED